MSLDADLKRIAAAESVPVAELERDWLRALVELWDADPAGYASSFRENAP